MPTRSALLRLLAPLAASLLVATGCGGGEDDGQVSAGSPDGQLSVTDQRGETLTLDGPARRIVTLPMPAAAMVIAVDQGPQHLAGMHPSSLTAIEGEVMGEMFPRATRIATDVVGEEFAPNVESLLALDPDVVVQWGNRGSEVIAPMENAGLNVVGLNYGTLEDVERWLQTFGTLLGRDERAQQMVDYLRESAEQIRAAGPEDGERPKILYFNRLADGLTVAGRGTFNHQYIELVGGQNAAADVEGLKDVNAEQVLAWDPDIILVGNFDEATPRDVYEEAVWRDVDAVRAKRVYQVPLGGYRWDPPSHESPLMWRWLAALATGADIGDLRDEVREQYRFFYGHELTDAQIDRILRLDLNADAAGYERFRAG